jgi:hypothetical protein
MKYWNQCFFVVVGVLSLAGANASETPIIAYATVMAQGTGEAPSIREGVAPLPPDFKVNSEDGKVSALTHTTGSVFTQVKADGVVARTFGGSQATARLTYAVEFRASPGTQFYRYRFDGSLAHTFSPSFAGGTSGAAYIASQAIARLTTLGGESVTFTNAMQYYVYSNSIGPLLYDTEIAQSTRYFNLSSLSPDIQFSTPRHNLVGAQDPGAVRTGTSLSPQYADFAGNYSGAINVRLDAAGIGYLIVDLTSGYSVGTSGAGPSGTFSMSAKMDPYFYTDPEFLSAHPEATLRVLDGIGNEPSSPVPEPSAGLLMFLGLGGLIGLRRIRGKSLGDLCRYWQAI